MDMTILQAIRRGNLNLHTKINLEAIRKAVRLDGRHWIQIWLFFYERKWVIITSCRANNEKDNSEPISGSNNPLSRSRVTMSTAKNLSSRKQGHVSTDHVVNGYFKMIPLYCLRVPWSCGLNNLHKTYQVRMRLRVLSLKRHIIWFKRRKRQRRSWLQDV